MKREWVVGFGVVVREGMFEEEAEDGIVGDRGRFFISIASGHER